MRSRRCRNRGGSIVLEIGEQNDVTLKMPAFEWVHVQLHQQKGMISLSPPTICNSAPFSTRVVNVGVRDSTYVLDGLLYHESDLRIEEHYTDRQLATASWTDRERSERAARRASEASQSPPHRHI
nr:Tn3 family transposase [Escherichia coli]